VYLRWASRDWPRLQQSSGTDWLTVYEAKVMQIFEGTNQIQRLVISRDLARG